MSKPIYDSRDPACKTPFGAVKAGETVTFTIHLPKLHHNAAPMLKLYQFDRWEEPLPVEMTLCGADYVTNSYTCAFTPGEPKLYAYCFDILADGKLQTLRRGGDGLGVFDDNAFLWQLTVYDPAMKAPGFLTEGVMYQIFPDRFARSGVGKEDIPYGRQLREDWGALPVWRPDHRGEVTNSDYFQGDLEGIRQKLDYLESLGVTVLYLNPIFEAHSNHRYNTADYRKIDPLLGTEADFRALCAAAKERGMGVILDGVFSHTGSDSVYFNREGRYGDGGAYRDPDSPYRPWYKFLEYPHRYECWWGFVTLPNVDELEPSYLEFICGDSGVLRKWLEAGASGWRLDVADELPDGFLDRLYICVKGHDPDCAVIGEVWEDASNKESYGLRRRYLLGGQMDSVMNYPFKDAVLGYIRWGSHELLYDVIMQILENYPQPVVQCLMNSLSTHDTVRAITELAGEPLEGRDRQWQEQRHYLPQEQYTHGCRLFGLASILQFGLPGIPCVYYGDEAGLTGYRDPFNRVCYPWGSENRELVEFIAALGQIRKQYPIFGEGRFVPYTFSREICAFARETADTSIAFVVNRSHSAQRLNLPPAFATPEVLAVWGSYRDRVLEAHSGVVLLAGGESEAVAEGQRMRLRDRWRNRTQ